MTFEDAKRFTVSRAASELLWLLSQKNARFLWGALDHLPFIFPLSRPPSSQHFGLEFRHFCLTPSNPYSGFLFSFYALSPPGPGK